MELYSACNWFIFQYFPPVFSSYQTYGRGLKNLKERSQPLRILRFYRTTNLHMVFNSKDEN